MSNPSQIQSTFFYLSYILRKIPQVFPDDKQVNKFRENLQKARESRHPAAGKVIAEFTQTLTYFRTTQLCKSLMALMKPLIETKKVDRILAFGGLSFGGPSPQLATRVQIQHAALVVIREMIAKENGGGQSVPIYLQDPQYNKQDVEVAQHFNMEILNCDIGHQMGWLAITDSSLIVDLTTMGFPIKELIFEISRPAALLLPFSLDITRIENWMPEERRLKEENPEFELPPFGTERPYSWTSPEYGEVPDLPGV